MPDVGVNGAWAKGPEMHRRYRSSRRPVEWTGLVTSRGGFVTGSESGADGFALATDGLAKRYGRTVALDGLDLRVPAGTVYGFLGPNGAGKTTTMRILTGLVRADAGRVELLGRPFGRGDRRSLHDVGALIEGPSFYPFLSGRENLRALAATGARVPATRIDELLGLVNLGARAGDRVSGYSLGMKQRLGIAAALLSSPRLLLLDEPANGLDPAGIAGMRDTLRALAAGGTTVFVSSHILSEVQQLADVVGIVARGRLVREGSVAGLLREAGTVRVRVAEAEIPVAGGSLEAFAGAGSVSLVAGPEPGWLEVRFDPARSAELNRALAAAGVYAARIETGSTLESLFLEVTGSSPDVGAAPPVAPPPGQGGVPGWPT
jgi:ABC-2 type transport system ATP-binding protein